jgi:N-acetylglucosaminyldiphosphoundecaprenol N-acetyl-beta-D-mannosaminyltransferase
MEFVNVLDVPIAATNIPEAADQIDSWIQSGTQRYVTVTGVHGIMESQEDTELLRIHQAAGMCVPDGMPTVWVGKYYGHQTMSRVYGPDLMLEIMERSPARGYRHFFYGGKEGVPELLKEKIEARFPGTQVVGTLSPPFRPMTDEEEADFAEEIARLQPDIIWVGLSTPKQERWMAAHVRKLECKVMIGVGAAFDFHAGLLKQAPSWMQKAGLEWFFRLCVEPRRLWRRYCYNNPRFIWKMTGQLLGQRRGPAA